MSYKDPKFLDRARAVFAANAHPSLADVRRGWTRSSQARDGAISLVGSTRSHV